MRKNKIGKYKIIKKPKHGEDLCKSCKKHYIFTIPFLNLYIENCTDNLKPRFNCKGFIKR